MNSAQAFQPEASISKRLRLSPALSEARDLPRCVARYLTPAHASRLRPNRSRSGVARVAPAGRSRPAGPFARCKVASARSVIHRHAVGMNRPRIGSIDVLAPLRACARSTWKARLHGVCPQRRHVPSNRRTSRPSSGTQFTAHAARKRFDPRRPPNYGLSFTSMGSSGV